MNGKKWLDSSLIKVVLGPRRAGKSIFSLMLLRGRQFCLPLQFAQVARCFGAQKRNYY